MLDIHLPPLGGDDDLFDGRGRGRIRRRGGVRGMGHHRNAGAQGGEEGGSDQVASQAQLGVGHIPCLYLGVRSPLYATVPTVSASATKRRASIGPLRDSLQFARKLTSAAT